MHTTMQCTGNMLAFQVSHQKSCMDSTYENIHPRNNAHLVLYDNYAKIIATVEHWDHMAVVVVVVPTQPVEG